MNCIFVFLEITESPYCCFPSSQLLNIHPFIIHSCIHDRYFKIITPTVLHCSDVAFDVFSNYSDKKGWQKVNSSMLAIPMTKTISTIAAVGAEKYCGKLWPNSANQQLCTEGHRRRFA